MQVHNSIVAGGPQLGPERPHRLQGSKSQRPARPSFSGDEVKRVRDRLPLTPGGSFGGGAQKRCPLRLDRPANVPARPGAAQGGNGRQSMKNIAHSAEADNKHTQLGELRQRLIFA